MYQQILTLEGKNINGIWARIIKNAFAPLFQGKFDFVVGNPPWINWESLPDDYKVEIVPLWEEHNLFSHKGFDAILGKSKDDISVLMTYISADKYLKSEGWLGFLITQSVFKTIGGGEGFRQFELGDGTPLSIISVDDMSNIKPFEGASNRTSAFILKKNSKTKYPVQYNWWYKPDGGSVIAEDITLDSLVSEKIATYHQFVAKPIDDENITSPWISGRKKALNAIKKIHGKSEYQARAGVCTWLNGVYWIDIVEEMLDGMLLVNNLSHRSRRNIESIQTTVEPDLIFPLLQGRDVQRWSARTQYFIIIPHRKEMGLKAIPENELAIQLSKTYAYFKYFEEVLRERSGLKRYFDENAPFYSIFNIGDYSFDPYKVVWREQAGSLTAAVSNPMNGRVVIPDHKLMMIPCAYLDEAHYIVATLNSTPARFMVSSYGVNIQMDTHIMNNINIPTWDSTNLLHQCLSDLSKKAHEMTESENDSEVSKIEDEIDDLVKKLWNITDEEMKEIIESLGEIT